MTNLALHTFQEHPVNICKSKVSKSIHNFQVVIAAIQ